MEYQKEIEFLENASNQQSILRTNIWIEINDNLRGTYNTNSQIKFKTTSLKTSLYEIIEKKN